MADSYSTPKNTTLAVAAPGVLGNDTDADGDTLSAILVANVSHGTLTLGANGAISYVPTTGYVGPDSFTYKANDGALDSNTVTVSLTVTATNAAPVAVADSYSTPKNTTLAVAAPGVLGNDTDADGDTLTAILVANVSHGTLTLGANGSISYVPTTAYVGPDSFTYKANDGALDSNTVTVSLTVTATNAAPVAVADSLLDTQEHDPGGRRPGRPRQRHRRRRRHAVRDPGGQRQPRHAHPGRQRFDQLRPDHRPTSAPTASPTRPTTGPRSNTVTVSLTVTATNAAPVAVADSLLHTQEHDPRGRRPGRARQRHRRRRQHPDRDPGDQRGPRHPHPEPERRHQLRPDHGLHRRRQLHLQGQRREPSTRTRSRSA